MTIYAKKKIHSSEGEWSGGWFLQFLYNKESIIGQSSKLPSTPDSSKVEPATRSVVARTVVYCRHVGLPKLKSNCTLAPSIKEWRKTVPLKLIFGDEEFSVGPKGINVEKAKANLLMPPPWGPSILHNDHGCRNYRIGTASIWFPPPLMAILISRVLACAFMVHAGDKN